MTWGRFYGVGVGPGDPQLLTLKAVAVLRKTDVIAIPKSKLERESVAWEIAKGHCRPDVGQIEIELPMTAEREVLEQAWESGAERIRRLLADGQTVAFITLGDPSLYSTYTYLLDKLKGKIPEERIETVPGIMALAAAAARVNLPLAEGDEPLLILPSGDGLEDYLGFPNLVLMKVSRRLPEILARLKDKERAAVLLSRVGHDNERIEWNPEAQRPDGKIDYLSLLIVKGAVGRAEEEN